MSGHTPGPWDRDWWERIIKGLHNVEWAHDHQTDDYNYPGFAAHSPDAKDAALIAKAPLLPEMAEALRKLLDQTPHAADDAMCHRGLVSREECCHCRPKDEARAILARYEEEK